MRVALLLIAITLPVVIPLLTSRMTSGHDVLEYLPRVTEFHENIRQGILLPRWAPDLSSGQGQPLFLFNPPLIYYLAEAWHLVGLDFVAAINAACVTIALASCFAMFLLGRHLYGVTGGIIAATAYVYAPYFLVDLYVRAAFAELSAFPFFPLAIYGLARRRLFVCSVAYAGLLFAHTPAALLFTPVLVAFAVFFAMRERSWLLLVSEAGAMLLGAGIAACVWLPSAVEAKFTNSHLLREGPLHFANHFVAAWQFFSVRWGYAFSVPGDGDGMPFTLGWAHLIIAAAVVIALAIKGPRQWRTWILFLGSVTVALCFLMTAPAKLLWDFFPLLQYVAFPWRILGGVIVCFALTIGAAAVRFPLGWCVLIVLALILANVRHARPAGYVPYDPLEWTPEQIASRGVLAATLDTFESGWVKRRPVFRKDLQSMIESRTPTRVTINVAMSSVKEIELPVSYFPGWRVSIDGAPAELLAPSNTGLIRVRLQPGAHRIVAEFRSTMIRWVADAISLFSLAWLFFQLRSARSRRTASLPHPVHA